MASAVTIVLNPVSGTATRGLAPRDVLTRATVDVQASGLNAAIVLTEGVGHARDLARGAVARGATAVVAWGGDGTVNEVATALAHTDVTLGIVPRGSGNGLARMLGVPCDPVAALRVLAAGETRRIDVGACDGRGFVNIAGVGLDAAIAHGFATVGRQRRGLLRYAQVTARELWTFRPRPFRMTIEGRSASVTPLMVAFANGSQYGNGAAIAPSAVLDDGRLDVVTVGPRSLLSAVRQMPALFSGRVESVEGVRIQRTARVVIEDTEPIRYHVDGEPCEGGTSLEVLVHPAALRVATPAREAQSTKR